MELMKMRIEKMSKIEKGEDTQLQIKILNKGKSIALIKKKRSGVDYGHALYDTLIALYWLTYITGLKDDRHVGVFFHPDGKNDCNYFDSSLQMLFDQPPIYPALLKAQVQVYTVSNINIYRISSFSFFEFYVTILLSPYRLCLIFFF